MNTTNTLARSGRADWSSGANRVLMIVTLASLALWFIPGASMALYPLRIFVTLVHEGGHAVATLLTGGSVERIGLDPSGSGVTLSRGGMPFFIYMAGYLGTTLFGVFCLFLARQKQAGRRGLLLLGAMSLLVTGLWISPLSGGAFGFFMGLAIGLGLIAGARFLKEQAAEYALAFLAVQLCLNALVDLRDLLFLTTRTTVENDAVFMTRMFGLTPWIWASLWAVMAVGMLALALKALWKR